MNFSELKGLVKEVEFDTVRSDSGNYFEAVLVKNNLAGLTAKLATFFDSPFNSGQKGVPDKVQEAIQDFGGIKQGQTLYFCQEDASIIFAMLWPWQDNYHITLKIAQKST